MTRWADWLRQVPGLAPLVRSVRRTLGASRFPGSAAYWQQRYAEGGDSGAGSYGKFARFKAEVLNGLFDELALGSAIEFGCGDGNQLRLLTVRDYLGVDISPDAVARCRAAFAGVPGRRFVPLAATDGGLGAPNAHDPDTYRGERADCALSLDVIYHLVEDAAFEAHLRLLFAAATRCVVIYSSDRDADAADGPHVRHRRFTEWVAAQAPRWRLLRHVPNAHPFTGDWRTGSFADFYVYVPRVAA